MKKALEGIRVLDLTQWLQGPVCAQYLADFGAEVIHVERPVTGDGARGVRSIKALAIGDWNQYFQVINRNKKSLAVDLKKEEGQKLFYELVEKSDVFLSNFQAENLRAWGLTWEKLREVNPRLIYATNSGYGHALEINRPSYDINVQALTGIMTRQGEPGEPPIYLGMGSGDTYGGILSAFGIMLALHQRRRTGRGQFLDASLYGAQLFMAAPTLQPFLASRNELYSTQQSRTRARKPALEPLCGEGQVGLPVSGEQRRALGRLLQEHRPAGPGCGCAFRLRRQASRAQRGAHRAARRHS